jgi:uncharacterized protein YukE
MAEGAGAFWSYVHADDEAEGGRIVELGRDVQRQYGLITGGELELFLDRDALEWGDDWRERIAEAVDAARFFIPVMTPSYFNSKECRRELIQFAREANRLGASALLLPILYTQVPALEVDEPADEAVILVKPRQYENWTDLRFRDRSSSEYREAVASLAQRLAETVDEISAFPAIAVELVEPESDEADAGGDDDDEPGVIDLIAEGEEAMPTWQAAVEQLGSALERLSEVTQQGATDMGESDARGAGAAGKVRVGARIAAGMGDPAQEILRAGEANTREVARVDRALSAILDLIAERPPADASEREQALQFFDSVQQMVAASAQGTQVLSELSQSLSETARMSRVFRSVARDLQRGLRAFVDAQAIYDEWDRRIREIRTELDETEPSLPGPEAASE